MPKKTVEKKIFSIDELKPKKHYKIKVKSFNKDKKLIGESPWIIFKTTGKNQAPPNVSDLDADFKGSTLVVTWNGSAARAEKDFKEFRIRVTSPDHPGVSRNFYDKDDKFNFNEDLNRKLFGSFEGTINITVYSRDTSDNESSGVSITAYADVPEDPTNVKLSAAVLGYNVSWDLPTFKNYDYTKIYESSSENGTYSVVKTERGSSTYVAKNNLSTVWVKVSHVNKAGAESNLVASVPPSITPIDPVPTDVTPPAVPTNLNWEDAGTESINGITTAAMRAHWEVSEITSGYKVRVTEDVINRENWAVYDVPALKAKVTNKELNNNIATLTLTAHSFRQDDYVTIFNVGAPFNGKHKITSVTTNTITFNLTGSNVSYQASDGDVIISSFVVRGLYPGTQYYGSILAYDSANNITQFVSEGVFTTSGTAGTVGSPIKIEGTTMAFGPNVSGTNDGLYINSDNYWYNTGFFNVGTSTNALSWDGVRLRLDGGIIARSGSFSGNIFLAGQNLENDTTASLIATTYLNIQSATWSSGVATVTTTTTPSPAWSNGDVIIISEASKQFDGQYVLISASGNTFTFSMTGYSSVTPITNVGKIARVSSGDRVIFNSSGIQGWEDNLVTFSLNRNKTSRIGGWTIKPSKIFAGTGSAAVGLNSSSGSSIRMYIGNDDPDLAPFRITQTGRLIISPEVGNLSVDVALGRVSPSSSTDKRTGIILNDSSGSGIENFWYLASTVSNNDNYFRVGTSTGSAISVQKISGGASKVTIKDYDIEGDTTYKPGAKQSFGGILIGRDIDGTKDGIKLDANNYWYRSNTNSTSQPDFKVGNSTKSMQFDTTTGLLKIVGGDISLTNGGQIKTSDSNTRVIMDSNGLYGFKSGVATFSINAATGDAEFAGKVVKNATIGTPRIRVLDETQGDPYPGIDVGETLLIQSSVDGLSNASITFTRTGTTNVEGSMFAASSNKNATASYGIGIGNMTGYPVIEAGWADSAKTQPRISIRTSSSTYMQFTANDFSLFGGSSSGIYGIPDGTSPIKYLAKNSNDYLRWVDAPTGTGGKTYTSADTDGIIVNNTNDTIRNAGYRMVGRTDGGSTRISTTNRIGFTSAPTDPVDGDIWITF